MNKKEISSLKGKSAAFGMVLCFVAVILMVGAFVSNRTKKQAQEELAKVEEEKKIITKEEIEEASAKEIELPTEEEKPVPEHKVMDEQAATEDVTQKEATTVWFDENSNLVWPASGATLLGYSMDKTVYFPTLEQYKYNPALVIEGKAGEVIKAAAGGVVKEIAEYPQTGVTVTMDIGNGYTATYGQLKDVTVKLGDQVNAEEKIGVLNTPTKYYSVEGPNLYFEIQKDGHPVNPLDFME